MRRVLIIILILLLAGCSSDIQKRVITDMNDGKLRQTSEQVDTVTQNDIKNLDDLNDLLNNEYKHSAGISAPQIGINRRYFVVRDFENNKLVEMVNPQILQSEGSFKLIEGCISIPGIYGVVNRSKKITVLYENRTGDKKKLIAENLLAATIQHEMDHLNGVLFYDVASDVFSKQD